MVFSSDRADFGFKIDFVRDTEDPKRVFRAFSQLIDFCQITDQILIKTLDIDIEPDILLDNIQQGSIIVWLKNSFKAANDNFLENLDLRLVSSCLVNFKASIINFINERTTINEPSELDILKDKFQSLARNTQVNQLGIYTPPNDKDLLLSIDTFQRALSELQEADKLYYLTPSSNLPVNRNFSISPESRENLLVGDTTTSEIEMILKFKKPDYLGDSKWQFRHDNKLIEAKMNDLDWLKRFKKREVLIAPGDAVKARVEIVTKYDNNREFISTKYTIQEVIQVIPIPLDNQLSLFRDENLGN